MNINYKDTPFPYFYGSLDKKMYDYAHKLWSTDENLKSYNISKNRSNIEITDRKLINYLTKVGAEVKALSENFLCLFLFISRRSWVSITSAIDSN